MAVFNYELIQFELLDNTETSNWSQNNQSTS